MGMFLSEIGGHWRDLLWARELVPELGFTLDTSHAGLFRSFAAAYPSVLGLGSDEGLELDRYVEELGERTVVAHVSDAHGLLGEGLPYGAGELDLDPAVARLAGVARYLVAEIGEPDPERSVDMKRAYHAIERASADAGSRGRARPSDSRRSASTGRQSWVAVTRCRRCWSSRSATAVGASS